LTQYKHVIKLIKHEATPLRITIHTIYVVARFDNYLIGVYSMSFKIFVLV